MATTSMPAAASERIAVSRPEPGPRTSTSTFFTPCSMAARAHFSAARCAANGVDLREPLKPTLPDDAHASTLPSGSVIDTIVLLNELLMCATPRRCSCVPCDDLFGRWSVLPLLRYLLLASDGALGSFARTRVGAGALSANGKSLAMTDPLQTVDLHLAFDVLGDVAPKVTFDGDVLVDVGAQLVDVGLGEVLHPHRLVNTGRRADLLGNRSTNSENVRKGDHRSLLAWDVYSGNTGHVLPLLALALLVTRVLTDHADVTGPANDFALLTHGLDAGANLHVFSFSTFWNLSYL